MSTGPLLLWLARMLILLLAWTGLAYGIHRLAHHRARWNRLERLHRVHHGPTYLEVRRSLHWHHFLLCFGSPQETLDIWFTLTLPALALAPLFPDQAPWLLGFHYLYEIFLSDERLDHNPRLCGSLTRYFAWGDYHLEHHRDPSRHFGLILTLWDGLCGSASALTQPRRASSPLKSGAPAGRRA